MGNCQAIDNASLVIQHPKGKTEILYSPVSAKEIMKINPGHYVALLLATTLYSSTTTATATATAVGGGGNKVNNNNTPLRVTRIKLLKPTDTLVLGHVYRLITTQEVMKGLVAKKQAKMNNQKQQGHVGNFSKKEISEIEAVIKKTTQVENMKQVKHERHRTRHNSTQVNSSSGGGGGGGPSNNKSRGASSAAAAAAWQPSLRSISEATTGS